MPTDNWFYAINGRQGGPVLLETLRAMAADGGLKPNDLVWREGMPQWAPAAHVPELSPPPGMIPAPYPPSLQPAPQPYVQPGYAASGQYLNYYPPQITYSGFWRRFAAWFLDALVIGAAGCCILMPVVLGMGFGTASGGRPFTGQEPALQLGGNLAGLLIGWLYEAFMVSSGKQATLGKMAMGVIVVDLNGQRLSFARATARFFCKQIYTPIVLVGIAVAAATGNRLAQDLMSVAAGLMMMAGYVMAAFTERKQALHDMIAGTLVMKVNP